MEATRAPHVTSHRAELVARRYLLLLLLVPLVAYIFPFVAERVPPLNSLSVSFWGHILDYGYGRDNEKADIVVFGDSTAIYDIDAVRLSRELGRKVITLPGTFGSLPVTGDSTLRRYLAGNPAPQLIVFYFAPWNLDVGSTANGWSYEGDEQVLRHDGLGEVWRLAVKHPQDMLAFPLRFYVTPSRMTFAGQGKVPKVQVQQGHVVYPHPESLKENCSLPSTAMSERKGEFVLKLKSAFTSQRTKTLVYLAPIPNCKFASTVQEIRYPGVDAAPPVILPYQKFADDPFYAHVLAPFESESTDLLGAAIRKSFGN